MLEEEPKLVLRARFSDDNNIPFPFLFDILLVYTAVKMKQIQPGVLI